MMDEDGERTPFEFDFIGVGGLAYDLMLSVDRLPLAGDSCPAEVAGRLPGGFGAHATCAAARLGLRAGYIGWVGDDAEGEMLREDFIQWNVNPAGIMCVRGEQTPFAVVIADQRGRRAILRPSLPLDNALFSYEQLQFAASGKVLYTFPRDLVWCRQLRDVTLESGGLLAVDAGESLPLRGDELRTCIQMADVVFISEASLAKTGLKSLRDLVGQRQWAIMTAGSRGAFGIESGQRKPVFQPAPNVPVVDTTGAGECFHAALIAARLNGAALPEALAFANAAAAIKVQQRGPRGGLPTRAEVEGKLRDRRYQKE